MGRAASGPEQCDLRWVGRGSFVIIGALLFVVYLVYLNDVPDFRPDQEHDAFQYIKLSRHLLAGEGYPSKHFLPGFPVLLAGLIGCFGLDWIRLKLTMIILALLGVILAQRVYQRVIPSWASTPLALVLASTPSYFDYAHRLMSEIPTITITLAALVALDRLSATRGSGDRLLWSATLIAGGAIAVLFRGNALALVPALFVGTLRSRETVPRGTRWAIWFALLAALLSVGAWSLRSAHRRYDGVHNVTYLKEIQAKDISALWKEGDFRNGVEREDASGMARRVYRNIAWYHAYGIASLFAPGARSLADVELYGLGLAWATLLLVPQFIGFIRLASRSPELATFLLCSLILIIIYPTGGSKRIDRPARCAARFRQRTD